MAHHTDPSGNTFVDTAFLNAAGRVKGSELLPEISLNLPQS